MNVATSTRRRPTAPAALRTLIDRYDPEVFDVGRRTARLRLIGSVREPVDAILHEREIRLAPAGPKRPDGLISAEPATWDAIAAEEIGGLAALRTGQVVVRHDLHLGLGFLAATTAPNDRSLRFRRVRTRGGHISCAEAGQGPAVLLIHGLGASKASFLSTVAALAPHHRAIAVDLPGFGDSAKPIAAYDPAYFARSMTALLDELGLDRADIVGNSMGGRVAIEMGLRHTDRVGRLALLAPSLAWRRGRQWAGPLRLTPPHLGLIQPAPRAVVEAIVRRAVPHGNDGWTAVGVDEFLRSYLTPRGRFAFYAAARNIYLEEPLGPEGFWSRLPSLTPDSLFVWGRRDAIVPIRFARHVRDALPDARHVELSCGHVPQVERPEETHAEILRFFAGIDGRSSSHPSVRPGPTTVVGGDGGRAPESTGD